MPDELVITSDTEEVVDAVTDAIQELVEEQNEHVEDIVEELTDTIEELVEEIHEDEPPAVTEYPVDDLSEIWDHIRSHDERLARLEVRDVTDEIAENHEESQTEELAEGDSETAEIEGTLEDIGPQTLKHKFHKFWFGTSGI